MNGYISGGGFKTHLNLRKTEHLNNLKTLRSNIYCTMKTDKFLLNSTLCAEFD